MACNSLFSYQPAGVNVITSNNSFNVSGSVNVAGYTTPGWTTTTTVPAVSHWHQRSECEGGVTSKCHQCCTTTTVFSTTNQLCVTCCSNTNWNNCAYTTPIYTETFTHPTNVHKHSGIPLFPSTSLAASATIDIETISSVDILIPPPGGQTPLFIESMVITISNFTITFDTFTINIPISESITVSANSAGTFDAQIAIPNAPFTDTASVNIEGLGLVTYGFSINPYILLCAQPVPPVSFVNLCLDTTFSVSFNNPVLGQPVSFTQGFSVLCPFPIEE